MPILGIRGFAALPYSKNKPCFSHSWLQVGAVSDGVAVMELEEGWAKNTHGWGGKGSAFVGQGLAARKWLLKGPGRVGPGWGAETGCERGSWHGIQAQEENAEHGSQKAQQKDQTATCGAVVNAVIERTFWIREPTPAARSFQSEGMADEPLYRGAGGDAFLE